MNINNSIFLQDVIPQTLDDYGDPGPPPPSRRLYIELLNYFPLN